MNFFSKLNPFGGKKPNSDLNNEKIEKNNDQKVTQGGGSEPNAKKNTNNSEPQKSFNDFIINEKFAHNMTEKELDYIIQDNEFVGNFQFTTASISQIQQEIKKKKQSAFVSYNNFVNRYNETANENHKLNLATTNIKIRALIDNIQSAYTKKIGSDENGNQMPDLIQAMKYVTLMRILDFTKQLHNDYKYKDQKGEEKSLTENEKEKKKNLLLEHKQQYFELKKEYEESPRRINEESANKMGLNKTQQAIELKKNKISKKELKIKNNPNNDGLKKELEILKKELEILQLQSEISDFGSIIKQTASNADKKEKQVAERAKTKILVLKEQLEKKNKELEILKNHRSSKASTQDLNTQENNNITGDDKGKEEREEIDNKKISLIDDNEIIIEEKEEINNDNDTVIIEEKEEINTNDEKTFTLQLNKENQENRTRNIEHLKNNTQFLAFLKHCQLPQAVDDNFFDEIGKDPETTLNDILNHGDEDNPGDNVQTRAEKIFNLVLKDTLNNYLDTYNGPEKDLPNEIVTKASQQAFTVIQELLKDKELFTKEKKEIEKELNKLNNTYLAKEVINNFISPSIINKNTAYRIAIIIIIFALIALIWSQPITRQLLSNLIQLLNQHRNTFGRLTHGLEKMPTPVKPSLDPNLSKEALRELLKLMQKLQNS